MCLSEILSQLLAFLEDLLQCIVGFLILHEQMGLPTGQLIHHNPAQKKHIKSPKYLGLVPIFDMILNTNILKKKVLYHFFHYCLTNSCLKFFLTSVVWTYNTFGNNFRINHKLTKKLKDNCALRSKEHFSFKYFPSYVFVRKISPKVSGGFGCFRREWVKDIELTKWLLGHLRMKTVCTVYMVKVSIPKGCYLP